jgi:CheY-like chemotaxis protein
LKRQGYRVSHAINGQEGVDIYHRDRADLVITDLNMPVMDGYAVIRTLREESPEIKIVVVAGIDRAKIEDCMHSMGITSIVTKPVSPTKLLDTVRKALDIGLVHRPRVIPTH